MTGITSLMMILAVVGSSSSFMNSGDSTSLFERYSKMKLLADCLGEITIARWRQQVNKASKDCEKSTFIPALLHQTPVVTVQQRRPPFHFVPNSPPSQQTVFISGTPQQAVHISPPQPYKTYYYVKQPYAPLVITKPFGSSHLIPSPAVHTLYERGQQSQVEIQPSDQRKSYTDPDLKFEDTQQFHDRQQVSVSSQPSIPILPHKVPFQGSKPYIPSRRIQKRDLSGFYAQTKSEGKTPASNRDQQLRSVIRSRVNDKLAKMTCIMRNMGMLDENLEPNIQFLEESLLELPVSNDLFVQLRSGMEFCKADSSCKADRPSFDEIPVTREFSSSLEFFRCFGRERLRACLKENVSGMIRLIENEKINDPISGFYEQNPTVSSTVTELEELLIGATGQFTDLLLL